MKREGHALNFHNLPTRSIKLVLDAGQSFSPRTFSAIQTEEIDVTLDPLTLAVPLDKRPAIHRGMATSCHRHCCSPLTSPSVDSPVETLGSPWSRAQGLWAWAVWVEGCSRGKSVEPRAEGVGRRIGETSEGWPQLKVNPELPFTVRHQPTPTD